MKIILSTIVLYLMVLSTSTAPIGSQDEESTLCCPDGSSFQLQNDKITRSNIIPILRDVIAFGDISICNEVCETFGVSERALAWKRPRILNDNTFCVLIILCKRAFCNNINFPGTTTPVITETTTMIETPETTVFEIPETTTVFETPETTTVFETPETTTVFETPETTTVFETPETTTIITTNPPTAA